MKSTFGKTKIVFSLILLLFMLVTSTKIYSVRASPDGSLTWYYAEKMIQDYQTGTSWKTIVTLTVPGDGGDYLIIAMMALSGSSTSSSAEIMGRLYVNSTDEWSYVKTEQDDADSGRYAHKVFCVRVETINGDTEFDLDIRNEGGFYTTYSAYAVITAIKLEEDYTYSEAYESSTLTLTTTEQDLVSDTISVGSTGYYLILASAEYQLMSTSNNQEPRFRLRVDGVDQGDYSQPEGEGSTGAWENWFHVVVKQLSAGNRDISIRANAHGSTNHYARRGRIFALRLTDSSYYSDYEYTYDDRHVTTGNDFPQTRLTLQFMPSEASDYLIISSGLMTGDASSNRWSEFSMDVDGTDVSYMRLGESDDNDILPFGGLYNATFDTSQHTIKLEWGEYAGHNPSPDPGFGTCRIFALKIPKGYNLNLHIMDWDLTDSISGARVYKDSDTRISDANGWANWTEQTGIVQIKVSYYGFWVNGTFSVNVDSDKTINVQCKLYDIVVTVQETVQNAILVPANVSVFNGSSTQANRIATGLTNSNGQLSLSNLPNNTLTFTLYGNNSQLVIGNSTQIVSSEGQSITRTADENYVSTSHSYNLIAFVGFILPHFFKRRIKKILGLKTKPKTETIQAQTL